MNSNDTFVRVRDFIPDILVELRYAGNEIIMPTAFDSFSKQADRDYRDVPDKEAVVNSWLLQETMIAAGFVPYEDEWWHFSDTVIYEPEKNFHPTQIKNERFSTL